MRHIFIYVYGQSFPINKDRVCACVYVHVRDGTCSVDTSNLDGEAALKSKCAVGPLHRMNQLDAIIDLCLEGRIEATQNDPG